MRPMLFCHSGRLLEEWAYQKSLLITKVFAGTITHTDGDGTEEKTERNIEFMYVTTRITHQQTWSICSESKQQEWKQSWHSPEEFKQRRRVYCGVRKTGVPKCHGAEIQSCIFGQIDKIKPPKPTSHLKDFQFWETFNERVFSATSLPAIALNSRWLFWDLKNSWGN